MVRPIGVVLLHQSLSSTAQNYPFAKTAIGRSPLPSPNDRSAASRHISVDTRTSGMADEATFAFCNQTALALSGDRPTHCRCSEQCHRPVRLRSKAASNF